MVNRDDNKIKINWSVSERVVSDGVDWCRDQVLQLNIELSVLQYNTCNNGVLLRM